jgi:hypothetical protein
MEPYFLSLYSLLGCFEEILQVLNRDDSKSTSSCCFFYLVTLKPLSLSQVCFYHTCLVNTTLFILKACLFFFIKKKEGVKRMQKFIVL